MMMVSGEGVHCLWCVNISSTLGMLDLDDHMSAASKDVYIKQLKNELSRMVLYIGPKRIMILMFDIL